MTRGGRRSAWRRRVGGLERPVRTCSAPIDKLSKNQGRHLNGDPDDAAGWGMDAAGTQAVAGDGVIVMVALRDRCFHGGVLLKNRVAEVSKAAPNLTTFNCLFCRVGENSGDRSREIEGFGSQ